MKIRVVLIVLVVIFMPSALAFDTQHRFKICVYVGTGDPDSDLDDRLEAFVKRELRALGDVDIVSEHSDWEFICTYFIMEIEFKDGTESGNLAIARGCFKSVPKYHFESYTFQGFDKPIHISALGAAYWGRDGLHEYAIQSVASIDKDYLEPVREINRKYFD